MIHYVQLNISDLNAELLLDDTDWSADMLTKTVKSVLFEAQKILRVKGVICFKFTDDTEIAKLNFQFRHKREPTDVLSFAANPSYENNEQHIGDVVIAFGVAKRAASKFQKGFQQHIAHLVAHGFLHCLGYDHQNDENAIEMEAIEIKILEGMGIANPYN